MEARNFGNRQFKVGVIVGTNYVPPTKSGLPLLEVILISE
jgi:hypothetical protein